MESASDFGLLMAKMAGSLVLVVSLLLLAVQGLKRYGLITNKAPADSCIRIVARQPLGPKQQLLLVAVQDQLLLLGVTPEGIQLLSSSMKGFELAEKRHASSPKTEADGGFESILKKLIATPPRKIQ